MSQRSAAPKSRESKPAQREAAGAGAAPAPARGQGAAPGASLWLRLVAGAGVLQAKLAAGGHDDPWERAADRFAGGGSGPRRAADPAAPDAALPGAGAGPLTSEQESRVAALRGGGRPLPREERAHFERRMGRDLSGVRVHDGPAAAAATGALAALAFTSGRDVAFAPGRFAPGTSEGRRLLGHELAHVAQQGQAPARGEPAGMRSAGVPSVQRQAVPELPGYTQEGNTCGAASLVTALMVWDRQRADPAAPNTAVISACDIILVHLVHRRTATIAGWTARGLNGEDVYRSIFNGITAVRASAAAGTRVDEGEYRLIGMALYFLYLDGSAGLSAADIWNLQSRLGLTTNTSSSASTLDAILNTPTITGLQPNQAAQVSWWARTGPATPAGTPITGHVVLVGRFADGRWYLSDQGMSPPTELVSATLPGLRSAIAVAMGNGSSWLHPGASPMILGAWEGARLLGGAAGVTDAAARAIVAPGTFLAEVDLDWATSGERVFSGAFVSRHSAAAHAQALPPAGESGLVVEMPRGAFYYFRATAVSDANTGATSIDTDDSTGGLLLRHIFYHAWLRPANASRTGSWISVY